MTEVEEIKQRIMDTPVIAAVKDEKGLEEALKSECGVIFLLFGTIVDIGKLTQRVKAAGKVAIVHMDLVEGLSNREIAVDGLVRLSSPDGIISTRAGQIRHIPAPLYQERVKNRSAVLQEDPNVFPEPQSSDRQMPEPYASFQEQTPLS